MSVLKSDSALWSVGFRPFFLLASVLAPISIGLWTLLFSGQWAFSPLGLPPSLWHAHEMLFGYSAAVIAGFLLTAVRNWTQLPTLSGGPLALLVVCWMIPRVLFFLPWSGGIYLVALFDLLFLAILAWSITLPIVESGQGRRQAGILVKVILLGVSDFVFLVAMLLQEPEIMQLSVYSAMYLIVALCLTMARRLIPFFVKSAGGKELANSAVLDRFGLIVFVLFWLAVITLGHGAPASILAGVLCLIHAVRLFMWRSSIVASAPLLWVLYIAYAFFVLGFAMLALMPIYVIPLSAAIHTFAVGGVGTFTIGMMSRVAWGHTGRDLQRGPKGLTVIFGMMVLAWVMRVFGPMIWPQGLMVCVALAAVAWVIAFAAFLRIYIPVLIGPRVGS